MWGKIKEEIFPWVKEDGASLEDEFRVTNTQNQGKIGIFPSILQSFS